MEAPPTAPTLLNRYIEGVDSAHPIIVIEGILSKKLVGKALPEHLTSQVIENLKENQKILLSFRAKLIKGDPKSEAKKGDPIDKAAHSFYKIMMKKMKDKNPEEIQKTRHALAEELTSHIDQNITLRLAAFEGRRKSISRERTQSISGREALQHTQKAIQWESEEPKEKLSEIFEQLFALKSDQAALDEQVRCQRHLDDAKSKNDALKIENYIKLLKDKQKGDQEAKKEIDAFLLAHDFNNFEDAKKVILRDAMKCLSTLIQGEGLDHVVSTLLQIKGTIDFDDVVHALVKLKRDDLLRLMKQLIKVEFSQNTRAIFRGNNVTALLLRELHYSMLREVLKPAVQQCVERDVIQTQGVISNRTSAAVKLLQDILHRLSQNSDTRRDLGELYAFIRLKYSTSDLYKGNETKMMANYFCLRVLNNLIQNPGLVGLSSEGEGTLKGVTLISSEILRPTLPDADMHEGDLGPLIVAIVQAIERP